MAREKSAWERMREKEEERLREEAERAARENPAPATSLKKGGAVASTPATSNAGSTPDAATIAMIEKADVIIEQVTNLYQMFVAGQERTPPITQRKHLEDVVLKIQAGSRVMKATQFQVNQFISKYNMYRDRWDKLVRDIESGKVVVRRRGA